MVEDSTAFLYKSKEPFCRSPLSKSESVILALLGVTLAVTSSQGTTAAVRLLMPVLPTVRVKI